LWSGSAQTTTSGNDANTFTLNVTLTAPDGTRTSVHQVAHFNTAGTTSIDPNEFFRVGCYQQFTRLLERGGPSASTLTLAK